MDISNIVLLTVVCLTSVHIQGILGVCNSTETPAINLCEESTLTVQQGSRIYLDSASAAPAFQRIQCTCTLSFAGSGSLNIDYRVQNNDPALTDCGVQLNFTDQTWGCVSQSLTAGHQGINNITYIKKFNGTANWYSCLGISSNFYSINLQCFPSRRYYLPDEVVNGGFSDWEALSECSVTCGTGTQEWVRRCNNPAPMNNGTECLAQDGNRTLEETETRPCNLSACPVGPVDGGFTDWSTWTTCTQTCGGGSRERSRSCTNPSPQNGGLDCTGSTSQSEECNINTCPVGPVDGGFTDWSTWTTCTQTCGGGNRERSRTCTNPSPQNGGLDCTGSTSETEQCNLDACPVNGAWSLWSAWSTCSNSCGGGGISVRSKTCSNPYPQNGGAYCSGDSIETEQCGTENCPVDGNWGIWSPWSSCPTSCGGVGVYQTRVRTCNSPAPQYGGSECSGDSVGYQICGNTACPIDGGWGDWQSWSQCSNTCGYGIQTRFRSCNNPLPQFGGEMCKGGNNEMRSCYGINCPVKGQWGEWSSWTCSVSCGTGIYSRFRECNSPAPENGGQYCSGSGHENGTCTNNPCQVNGNWGQWSPWSSCSSSCGNGTLTRTRLCNNPVPKDGGENCSGSSISTSPCFLQECAINGNWGLWSPWSICAITCGSGTVSRIRECNNPEPDYGGANCYGDSYEIKTCDKKIPCPIDGAVGPWSPWSICSASCGIGEMSRLRLCNNPVPKFDGKNCTDILLQTNECNMTRCSGSGTNGGTTASPAQVGESTEKDDTSLIWGVVGGIIGGLLFLLLLILLICCICRRRRRKEIDNTRRPSTGPRSVRYVSHGDDVTVTENELYHYDGETPSHATNALFIGGIPETPNSPGHIPHISVGTGDSYAVIMDSNRSKPKGKERPTLDTFNSREDKGNTEANGDVRASTDTVKLSENYNEPDIGRGVENPAYDENYIAPYDSADGETQPKTSTSSPSPYDYIDNEKLKRDDAEFENEKLAGDYATLPDDIDDKTDVDEDNDRYKRFISSEPEESPDDGYMKSPKRDRTFEFPDSS